MIKKVSNEFLLAVHPMVDGQLIREEMRTTTSQRLSRRRFHATLSTEGIVVYRIRMKFKVRTRRVTISTISFSRRAFFFHRGFTQKPKNATATTGLTDHRQRIFQVLWQRMHIRRLFLQFSVDGCNGRNWRPNSIN